MGLLSKQRVVPQEKRRGAHHEDEQRAQPYHHVEGVVKELDVVRPGIRGNWSSPATAAERAVCKKTEEAWDDTGLSNRFSLTFG